MRTCRLRLLHDTRRIGVYKIYVDEGLCSYIDAILLKSVVRNPVTALNVSLLTSRELGENGIKGVLP